MRKLVVLGVLMLALAGCQNTVGPFAYRGPQRVDDPAFPIPEQQRRARDRYGNPDDTPTLLPRIDANQPNNMSNSLGISRPW